MEQTDVHGPGRPGRDKSIFLPEISQCLLRDGSVQAAVRGRYAVCLSATGGPMHELTTRMTGPEEVQLHVTYEELARWGTASTAVVWLAYGRRTAAEADGSMERLAQN